MKLLRLMVRNLLRNRRRTTLTVLSIAVSLFLFSALISVASVTREIVKVTAASKRIICHSKAGLTYGIPQSYRAKIASIPHVRAVSAWTSFGLVYRDAHGQFPDFAVDPETLTTIWPDWKLAPDVAATFLRARTGCLVGRALMQRFGWHPGQRVALRSLFFPGLEISFEIIGDTGANGPSSFFLYHRDYFNAIAESNPARSYLASVIGAYWVLLDEPAAVPDAIAAIDRTFANSHDETETEAENGFFVSFLSAFGLIFFGAKVLSLVVLVTISLVAANTAAIGIRERRYEVAVMRAIGFESTTVVSCMLGEHALIGLFGGILGCLLNQVLLHGVIPRIPGMPAFPQNSAWLFPATLLVATAIGVLGSVVSATAAARGDIVSTIRAV